MAEAGIDFGSLTAAELRAIQAAAAEGAREHTRAAAAQVLKQRRQAEATKPRQRLRELEKASP